MEKKWIEELKLFIKWVSSFNKVNVFVVSVFYKLELVICEGNVLDVKMYELILLVVVVIIWCDGCIVVYVGVVKKVGVIKEEIVVVLGIVILFNVGVVYVYFFCVFEVYGEFGV